jgi:hypothetical protein
MRAPGKVFVLTTDPTLAARLQRLGGSSFNPPGANKVPTPETTPPGAYYRSRGGSLEWDIWIGAIAVEGDETIWEAAGVHG